MRIARIVITAAFALCAIASSAYEANLNVDWKFAKGGGNLFGLDAALKANEAGGKQVYDVTFDDSKWECVSVPHCVNAHDTYDGHALDAGERDYYRGWMFYRKSFTVPQGRHFFVEFETVRQSVYLYVNGAFAGFYEAGITASGYDITPFVKPGQTAQITVVTENTAARGTQCFSKEMKEKPGDWAGTSWQWSGADFNPVQGGLVGNVRLFVKENDAYITLPLWNTLKTKGVYIYAKDFDFASGSATVTVEADIKGAGEGMKLAFEVNGRKVVSDSPVKASAKFSGLTFWSPSTPHLYDVKVSLLSGDGRELDSTVVRTGFRKVEFAKGKGLLVNGVPTWLPGYAQRANDSWAAIGFAPDWLQDYDAELLRSSGANFVRWMHVAPKPGPVRAFDKAGVVNVCPAGDKEGEAQGRNWEQRMEAMEAAMIYFRNSPSVFFWEAGNNQISADHMKAMRLLKERIDPNGWRFIGCRTLNTPEQIAEAEYVGTMIHRHDTKAGDAMAKTNRYLPVVETEYCREESARRIWDRFSPPDYNFICKRLSSGAKQWMYNCYDMTQEEMALSNASTDDGYGYFYGNRAGGKLGNWYVACAMLCWTDCNQHGRNSNTENCRSSGRVDAVRIPKENYYVHQVMYSAVPKVKILGHWNYPKKTADNYLYNEKVDDGKEITYTGGRKQRDPEHKTVWVIGSLSVDHVKLFVNGREKGVAKAPEKLFDFKFDNVDVTESGYVEAVAYDASGREIACDRIETVGASASIMAKLDVGPKGWLADGSDIAMVTLQLVDKKGLVLPLATNRIDFTFAFNGKTVAETDRANKSPTFMGGWNSGTFEATSPVGKNWVNFENGICRVFVRAGRETGIYTLNGVCSNGMKCKVEFPLVPVKSEGGLLFADQQSYKPNKRDYTVRNAAAPVRDLEAVAHAVEYTVWVNGRKVEFPRRHPAFKPDASTGVVCPYEPLVRAIREAGAKFDYEYSSRKVPKAKKYLRKQGLVYKSVLTLKLDGGKTVDAVAGLTVLFENEGKDKNLTNFEMTDEKGVLTGEAAAILGYIPGISVKVDENARKLLVTVR